MSAELYEYEEESSCACGKGKVVKYCYEEEKDDWGGYTREYHKIEINCPYCKNKYHVEEKLTRNNPYSSCWDGDPFSYDFYLVPNHMNIPKAIEKRRSFCRNIKEEIVNIVTQEELIAVIEDMKNSKYSTRVSLSRSQQIIAICKRALKTRALKNIIPYLVNILSEYENYEWNPDTIAEYKQEEAKKIKENEEKISQVLENCHRLTFRKVYANEKNFDIDKNILSYGKKSISFNTEIHQIISDSETAYIVLSKFTAPKTVVDYLVNNIYCVDKNLNILWQVCAIKGKVSPIYYDHIVKMDDRFIYADEFMGKKYIIDKSTGYLKGYIDFCGEYEEDKTEARVMYK